MSQKGPTPIWLGYLWGLIAALALVLLGGEDNIYALGLALFFPGLLFIIHPPTWGISPSVDRAVLIFLALLLAAFIPQFYWPDPGWREGAKALGIDLPGLLSLQPRISVEVWLQFAAGIAWLYAIYAWPLNDEGRQWFFFSFSSVFSILAAATLWGNLHDLRYPGSSVAEAFSFFPNWSQTAGFLAMGGLACFAFAVRGFQKGAVTPLMGLLAFGLCLGALVSHVSELGLILMGGGLFAWYLWRIRLRPKMRSLVKFGLPSLLLLLVVFYFAKPMPEGGDHFVLGPQFSGLKVLLDGPLTGVGLGNFDAVWPQYAGDARPSDGSQSGLVRLIAEIGLIGLIGLILMLRAYIRSWRQQQKERGIGLRVGAILGVSIFLLQFLISGSGHEVGYVYMALLLAAAALPSQTANLALPSIFWRVLGGLLVSLGIVWVFAAMTEIAAHSTLALEKEETRIMEAAKFDETAQGLASTEFWLGLKPFDWRAYHWRAKFTLAGSGAIGGAETLFEQARYVEPALGEVPFEEGFAWVPYSPGRAASAWKEAFGRGMEAPEEAFQKILEASEEDRALRLALSEVSQLGPEFRVLYLERLSGRDLMTAIEEELSESPSLEKFSRKQRSRLLERWISEGDLVTADRFLDQWGDQLAVLWSLRSLSKKEKADFAAAVGIMRTNLPRPVLPELELEPNGLIRTKREFSANTDDRDKGLLLFQFYFEAGDYEEALAVCELMKESESLSTRLHYWRAECFYRIGDLVESWIAFDEYMALTESEHAGSVGD